MSGKTTDTSISDKVSLAESQCVCNICYKLCASRTDLLLHQHCHRNSCPVCGETFSKKELLQTHMLQHCPNTEHYVCNIEGCNRRFSNSGLLQRHIENEHVTSPSPHLTTHGSPRPHRSSESSDWSPQLLPHHSPTVCSPSFRTPSVSWRLSESPSARQEYIRSPSTPLTSPLCRRSIGSEGGPFKPYRSPGPTRDASQPESWRPQTPRSVIEEQLKYIHDVSMLQPQITQLISQQVYAQQQNMTSPSEATKQHTDVLFEHHIVKSQQAPFLYRENRSITVGVSPQHILAPQPMKASDSHHSKQPDSLKRRTSSSGDIEHRTMTPEPSPNLPSDSKHALVSSLAGVENMEGLELLGQVSSQLSRMHESEPMKTKQRPAPLELPQEVQFALTPPYTGTPRYLWTPTKTSSATYQHISFFSPSAVEQPKIRVGREWQADIPDLQPKDSPPALPGSPLYTPPKDCDEVDKREEFFSSYSDIFPNSEYLHHCIHLAGGDLNRASKLARCPVEPCMPETHPLYKYRYTVGWRWGYEDQQKFSTLFQQLGKNLPQIARWMPDKSTADVIEYYYFWKKRYPEAYKLWRHRQPEIKIEPPEIRPAMNLSAVDTIHYHPGPYEAPPAQRPAPTKAKRGRNKEIVYFETEAYTTHDAKGNKEIKFRQKKVVNPYNDYRPRNKPAPQPLGSYKCKVCGKEFQKVKSRSAHMKTHKRQQNNALAAAAQQQAQQAQQQQQVQQQVQQQQVQQQQLQAAQQQLLSQVPSLHMPPQAPT